MLSGVVCMLSESRALRAVSVANEWGVSKPIQQMASLQHMPVDEKKKKSWVHKRRELNEVRQVSDAVSSRALCKKAMKEFGALSPEILNSSIVQMLRIFYTMH